MPPTIDSTTLVPLGAAITVTVAVIGCTWRLSSRMTSTLLATRKLEESIESLTHSLDSHVHRSDTRDEDNKREHAALARCCDVQAQAIKGISARMDEVILPRLGKVETCCDRYDDRISVLDRRLAVLEAQDAG